MLCNIPEEQASHTQEPQTCKTNYHEIFYWRTLQNCVASVILIGQNVNGLASTV